MKVMVTPTSKAQKERSVSMKIALTVTLSMASLFLSLAMVSMFAFYVDSIRQPTVHVEMRPSHIADLIASAENLSTLKQTCNAMVQSLNRSNSLNYMQLEFIEYTYNGIKWLVFIGGAIFSVALFYVYFILRRTAKSIESDEQNS